MRRTHVAKAAARCGVRGGGPETPPHRHSLHRQLCLIRRVSPQLNRGPPGSGFLPVWVGHVMTHLDQHLTLESHRSGSLTDVTSSVNMTSHGAGRGSVCPGARRHPPGCASAGKVKGTKPVGVSVCHDVSVKRRKCHRVGRILRDCPVTLLQ